MVSQRSTAITGRRRLRRNSLDRPIVELVEHEIADAQNRLPLELKEVVVEHAV